MNEINIQRILSEFLNFVIHETSSHMWTNELTWIVDDIIARIQYKWDAVFEFISLSDFLWDKVILRRQ